MQKWDDAIIISIEESRYSITFNKIEHAKDSSGKIKRYGKTQYLICQLMRC